MFFNEFLNKFSTELAIIQYYIKIRYQNDRPTCNHCGSHKISHHHDRPKFFQCNNCNNSFSIFTDTIFEHTSTDLRKWFYAIHLMINSKKGVSGYQLRREIDVTYKTAWRILKQIRTTMKMNRTPDDNLFHAFVEVDETYVGGKPRKTNKDGMQVKSKRGRGTKKQPVVGLYDRENKRVFAKVAPKNEKGKQLTGKQLLDIIKSVCDTFFVENIFEKIVAQSVKNNVYIDQPIWSELIK